MVSFFLSTFVSAYFICGVDGFIFVRVLNLLLLGYCWVTFYYVTCLGFPTSQFLALLFCLMVSFFFSTFVSFELLLVTFFCVRCLGYLNGVGCIVKHVAVWNGGH